MVRLISRQPGSLAALKLTKLFGINDFRAAKDSGKVLIIIIYCYLIIKRKHDCKPKVTATTLRLKVLDPPLKPSITPGHSVHCFLVLGAFKSSSY